MLQANSASGMSVSDDCKQKFMELKRKQTLRYIIFKIDGKLLQITLEKTAAPGGSYEDFTAQLPENDCQFGIYDFDFTAEANCQKSKIFFSAWYVIHLIRHSVLGS
jgi:cofilin